MTPREVLKLTLVTSGLFHPDARETISDAMADTILRNLKSHRLFIGPEVATEEMLAAVKPFPAHLVPDDPNDPRHIAMWAATLADQFSVKTLWRDLVTEWQRGGGA